MTEHDLLVGKHHIRSKDMNQVSPFGKLYEKYSTLLSMGEKERESFMKDNGLDQNNKYFIAKMYYFVTIWDLLKWQDDNNSD
jgi:hypothetical protein